MAIGSLLWSRSAASQEPTACRTCRVELTLLKTLRSDLIVTPPTAVAQLADGTALLGFADGKTPLLAVAPDWTRVTVHRRRGPGPKEYGDISAIRARSNGGWIAVDQGNRRIAFDGVPATPWRAFLIPYPVPDFAISPSGTLIVNGVEAAEDRTGQSLRTLDTLGKELRTFEEARRTAVPLDTRPKAFSRRLLATRYGIWVANTSFRYVLSRWSGDGIRRYEARRTASWFPEGSDRIDRTAAGGPTAPEPGIAGIGVVSDTLGVVLGAAVRSDWRKAMREVPARRDALHRSPGGVRYELTDPALAYDTVLELFDLRTGTVIASSRVNLMLAYLLAPGLVAGFATSASGELELKLYRLSLRVG